MNKTFLLGRLTRNPDIRYSQNNNMKVAKFTLAVDRNYAKAGEERQADFINIVTFSKLADFVEKYLKQGIQICLCGRIQTRNYDDDNGLKRYITEVIADEIKFADAFKNREDVSILSGNGHEESNDDFVSDDLPF